MKSMPCLSWALAKSLPLSLSKEGSLRGWYTAQGTRWAMPIDGAQFSPWVIVKSEPHFRGPGVNRDIGGTKASAWDSNLLSLYL